MSNNDKTPPGQEKDVRIFVNTLPKTWSKKEISFEDLITLAFPNSNRKEFDVTYIKGKSDQEGELLNTESVNVHPKMEFLVTPTNES